MQTIDDNRRERIRETYDEFTVGEETVAMISDPLNEHAWIQSTEATVAQP